MDSRWRVWIIDRVIFGPSLGIFEPLAPWLLVLAFGRWPRRVKGG